PYGAPRGSNVTAPDNRGFLNQPLDGSTGLTVVGVRQYDPTTGRFITDDPILEKTDATQLNGYGYAGNNPVVRSDPTGTRTDDLSVNGLKGAANDGRYLFDGGLCAAFQRCDSAKKDVHSVLAGFGCDTGFTAECGGHAAFQIVLLIATFGAGAGEAGLDASVAS